MIEVTEALSKKDIREFIRFPYRIYENNPYWVAPLLKDMRAWAKKKDPFFENGDLKWFLARRNDEVVGRIGVSYNKLFNERNNENSGFWGFFECIDEQEVANALFERAREESKAMGFDRVFGPCTPSPNHDFGLLVDGYDDAPRIMSTYNPPYYVKLVENAGMTYAKQLYAYKMTRDSVFNDKLQRGVELVKKRYKVNLRKLDKKNLDRDMGLIKEIWNNAWDDHWGFTPFTDSDVQKLKEDFQLMVEPDLILFAEMDGKTIGMVLALPDYNEKFITFKGKLFPFNFLKLLFGKKDYKWLRIVLLGILPEYQKRGIDALFFEQIINTGMKMGFQYGDASWILEDNDPMNRGMKLANAEIYKKWNLYEAKFN